MAGRELFWDCEWSSSTRLHDLFSDTRSFCARASGVAAFRPGKRVFSSGSLVIGCCTQVEAVAQRAIAALDRAEEEEVVRKPSGGGGCGFACLERFFCLEFQAQQRNVGRPKRLERTGRGVLLC